MRASSSPGEQSEHTDVAGEGIAKAAAGKSACFGPSCRYTPSSILGLAASEIAPDDHHPGHAPVAARSLTRTPIGRTIRPMSLTVAIGRPESTVDRCERTLRHAILSGELRPGELLPPERTLAASFDVNRVTVRSALTRLASSNLVSVRQGRGYRVEDFHQTAGPEQLSALVAAREGQPALVSLCRELLRARRHLAGALVERLAELAATTTLDTTAVSDAVDAFAEAVDVGELTGIVAADTGVVRALLQLSSSSVLQLCFNPLLSVLESSPSLRAAVYAEPETNLVAYRWLLSWLKAPTSESSTALLALLSERDAATLARL